MFHQSLRKIQLIETTVLAGSEKYLDVLEGLSITTSEIGESGSSLNAPKVAKLSLLASDINHALNEAHLEIRNCLSRTQSDLAELTAVYGDDASNTPSELSKSVECRLKQHLSLAYDQVMESVDFKATVLRIIQRILDNYVKSVAAIGDESGALQSINKVKLVAQPLLSPSRYNLFFSTTEVQYFGEFHITFAIHV